MKRRNIVMFALLSFAAGGLLVLAFLRDETCGMLTGDERGQLSFREYLDNLAKRADVQKLLQSPNAEDAAWMEDDERDPALWPRFEQQENIREEVRAALAAMLERGPRDAAMEAVAALRAGLAPQAVKSGVIDALFAAGYDKEKGWLSSSPVFEALVLALEGEKDMTKKTDLIHVLVLQYDPHTVLPYCRQCSEERAIRKLVAVVNPAADVDMPLVALIGFNAHRWADVADWFQKNASREAKGAAYLPTATRVLENMELARVVEVLTRVKEIGDDFLFSSTCMYLRLVVTNLGCRQRPGGGHEQDTTDMLKSTIKSFVLERAQAPPFDDETEYQELRKQRTPGVISDATYAMQKLQIRRFARAEACNVLGQIGDSECLEILKQIATNPKHDVEITRRGALQALQEQRITNPDAIIDIWLRILVEHNDLPAQMRSEALQNIIQTWVYGGPGQKFFESDKNFPDRLEAVRKLLHEEVEKNFSGHPVWPLLHAIGLMRFFDRRGALVLLEEAQTKAKDDATRKAALKVRELVENHR